MAGALGVTPTALFDPDLLVAEPRDKVVTLPAYEADEPEMRTFVETTLATVGVDVKWGPA